MFDTFNDREQSIKKPLGSTVNILDQFEIETSLTKNKAKFSERPTATSRSPNPRTNAGQLPPRSGRSTIQK
jgi:hypothetical protein